MPSKLSFVSLSIGTLLMLSFLSVTNVFADHHAAARNKNFQEYCIDYYTPRNGASGNNSLQALQRFFNTNLTLDSMLQRVKNMIEHLPRIMVPIIKFAVLTGLRPSEACESVRLLNKREKILEQYYNPEQQCLEHFRFPVIFLRTTKKAYLSYLSTDNYHYFANLSDKTPLYLERY